MRATYIAWHSGSGTVGYWVQPVGVRQAPLSWSTNIVYAIPVSQRDGHRTSAFIYTVPASSAAPTVMLPAIPPFAEEERSTFETGADISEGTLAA